MAEGVKISALGAVSALLGNEPIPLVQNGVTSSVTTNLLKTFITSGGGGSGGTTLGWIVLTAAPYNADPTGVLDSTLAFQTAVNAAANSTLYIPPGTYKVTIPGVGGGARYAITITSPVNIIADPKARIVTADGERAASGSTDATFFVTTSDFHVEGGIWDGGAGNYAAGTGFYDMFRIGINGITFYDNISFRKTRFVNQCSCMEIYNVSNVWIEDNWFDGAFLGQVTFHVNARNISSIFVTNNYFGPDSRLPYEQLNFLGESAGTFNMSDITISGNVLNAGDEHDNDGMCNLQLWQNDSDSSGPNAGYYDRVTCTGNHFYGGQNCFSTTGTKNSTFSNNTMKATPNWGGIEVGNNWWCTYSGNTIDGNNGLTVTTPNGIVGIWETGASRYCTYTGNTIRNIYGPGIQIVSGEKVVTGNLITTDIGNNWGGQGITTTQEFASPSITTGIVISGNLINLGGPGRPIVGADTSEMTITGNTIVIETNTNYAIRLDVDAAWGILVYDNIYISGNVIKGSNASAQVFFGTAGGSTFGPNTRFEYYNADGSATKVSTGWAGPATAAQNTSKSTTLSSGSPSLNCYQLDITMNNASMNPGACVNFSWPNTLIQANDMIGVSHQSGGTIGNYLLNAIASSNNAQIYVTNIGAATTGEAIILRASLKRNPDI